MQAGQAPSVLFEAVIVPHRSLSLTGLRVLLGVVMLSCVGSAVAFAAIGAWPVGVFSGLELLLAAFLFRLHYLAARASELVILSEAGLRVVRTSPRGVVRALDLSADWLRVRLLERPGRVPALLLEGQGQQEEIGRDLGEEAKRDLAAALAAALHRRRHPAFDNAQLRV